MKMNKILNTIQKNEKVTRKIQDTTQVIKIIARVLEHRCNSGLVNTHSANSLVFNLDLKMEVP